MHEGDVAGECTARVTIQKVSAVESLDGASGRYNVTAGKQVLPTPTEWRVPEPTRRCVAGPRKDIKLHLPFAALMVSRIHRSLRLSHVHGMPGLRFPLMCRSTRHRNPEAKKTLFISTKRASGYAEKKRITSGFLSLEGLALGGAFQTLEHFRNSESHVRTRPHATYRHHERIYLQCTSKHRLLY